MNPLSLFYPSAIDWMWNYCIHLGPFTDSKGDNYDLGVYIDPESKLGTSAAIVYGNTPGNYLSGTVHFRSQLECYVETWKRASSLNLI